MPETIDSANAAASSLFLGQNGEWWDSWLIVAVIFAALVAIAIGVTTAGSIVSHKREASAAESALEHFKLETAAHAADANERIAELSTQSDQLRKDTAEANVRALEAQLALERFRAPRSLTAAQQKELRDKLLPFAGTISRVWTMPSASPDTAGLADLLIHVLEQANWSVGRATSQSGQSFPGVVVSYRGGTDAAPQASALVEYLASVGIPATVAKPFDDEGGLMPASKMVSPAGIPNIIVVVGSKT